MSCAKDVRVVLKKIEKQGWSIEVRKRSGHLKLTNPANGEFYFCGSTPSDHRALRALIVDLRKRGAIL